VKKKSKVKIHTDKRGRNYIKKSYFVGGKMKFQRIYVIDGIPEEEFFYNNATDIEHTISGEYWLISTEQQTDEDCDSPTQQVTHFPDNSKDDLPF